jgi:hypothetical protein
MNRLDNQEKTMNTSIIKNGLKRTACAALATFATAVMAVAVAALAAKPRFESPGSGLAAFEQALTAPATDRVA